MKEELLRLADRCEAAAAPDRELDIAIAVGAAGWKHQPHVAHNFKWHDGQFDVPGPPPKYSASLDAAMTLVPEGWRIGQLEENWRSGRWHCHTTTRPSAKLIAAFDDGRVIGYDSKEAEATTAALALCAAALRASVKEQNNGG